MEVTGQLHSPAALPPGKDPWYPLDRRLGGPQSRSGYGGEEKNSQPPRAILTHTHWKKMHWWLLCYRKILLFWTTLAAS